MVLMGLVLVLGIIFAIPAFMAPPEAATTVRPDEVPLMEAMSTGQQPAWLALLNPLLGVVGVFVGGLVQRHMSWGDG